MEKKFFRKSAKRYFEEKVSFKIFPNPTLSTTNSNGSLRSDENVQVIDLREETELCRNNDKTSTKNMVDKDNHSAKHGYNGKFTRRQSGASKC